MTSPLDHNPHGCSRLEWDSEFFGFAIGSASFGQLSNARLGAIAQWARTEGVRCVYVSAPGGDVQSMRAAEQARLRLVDVKLDFEQTAVVVGEGTGPDDPLETVDRSLVTTLSPLVAETFIDSRFFVDEGFPRDRCRDLYVRWLDESFGGAMGDAVLVKWHGSRPLGLVTCGPGEQPAQGRIGLVAVSPAARGQGIGAAVVNGALEWFAKAGFDRVNVSTQGWNVAAQRLYQRAGFTTVSCRLIYHYWPD